MYHMFLNLVCCVFLLCSLQNYSIMEDNSILPDCGEEYNPGTELGMPSCDYLDIDSLHEMRPTKHDLSVMQLNIRGLLNKQDQVKELINESQVDAILLCKTWLNNHTESLVKSPSYKLFSDVRGDRIGGGVGIFIYQSLRT